MMLSPRQLAQSLLLGALLCLLFSVYQTESSGYPFYFLWDMDHVTALDSLMLQSGRLPAHLNHPGFGMFLWLKATLGLSKILTPLSIYQLSDISASLSPILGIAELTDFHRANAPWVSIFTVAALWLALSLEAGSFLVAALLLAMIGLQGSFFYDAVMVRTEHYSMLYWALAACLLSFAAKKDEGHSRTVKLLVAAGIFLGLAYLTKVQSVIYLLGAPVLYFFLRDIRGPAISLLSESATKKLSVGNVSTLLILIIGGGMVDVDAATFTKEYALNIFACGLLAAAGSLCAASHLGKWKNRPELSVLQLLLLGFNLSFLLHFLMFLNPAQSLRYLFVDARMLFYRSNTFIDLLSMNDLHQGTVTYAFRWNTFLRVGALNLFEAVKQLPVLVLINAITAGALFYFVKNRRTRFLVALLCLIAVLNLAFGVRPVLRDLLWAEPWLIVCAVLFLFRLKAEFPEKKWAQLAPITGIAILLLSNAGGFSSMIARIDANYPNYGYRRDRFFKGGGAFFPLNASYRDYTALMKEKYPGDEERVKAADFVVGYRAWKHALRTTFPNLDLSLRSVNELREGRKTKVGSADTLEKIPDNLRGSLLVDQAGAATNSYSFERVHMVEEADYWNKLKRSPRPDTLLVLPRTDLDVFFFSEVADGGSTTIQVNRDGKSVTLRGRALKGYEEIPVSSLGKSDFFVIARKASVVEAD